MVTNPLLIGEVLSKSTRTYDLDEKFAAYRTIESFIEYLLIDQYSCRVLRYQKQDDQKWTFQEYEEDTQKSFLSSCNYMVSIGDIYDRVDFTE